MQRRRCQIFLSHIGNNNNTSTILHELLANKSTMSSSFPTYMASIMNGAALAFMISIGNQTGLFKTMATFTNPVTCQEIANASELNARYVQEWLGAMVTGKIVHFQEPNLYVLPKEHAQYVTGTMDCTAPTRYLAMLGAVESKIVSCFKHGGGLPYTEYTQFYELMDANSRLRLVHLPTILQQVSEALVEKLQQGAQVCDVGCGSGYAVQVLGEAYSKSSIVGVDLNATLASKPTLPNTSYVVGDAISYLTNKKQCFDLITTFDVVHDQAKPLQLLQAIYDALAENGCFLMVDIFAHSHVSDNMNVPMAPFYYTISTMHCMSVSLAQEGAGLGTCWYVVFVKSYAKCRGIELAQSMLKQVGFLEIEMKQVKQDRTNAYFLCKK